MQICFCFASIYFSEHFSRHQRTLRRYRYFSSTHLLLPWLLLITLMWLLTICILSYPLTCRCLHGMQTSLVIDWCHFSFRFLWLCSHFVQQMMLFTHCHVFTVFSLLSTPVHTFRAQHYDGLKVIMMASHFSLLSDVLPLF